MFNLSDDIIEVFRPIVDNYVFNNLTDEILFKQQHREDLINLTNYKVKIDGRKQTIANAINIYLDSIFKYLNEEEEFVIFPDPVLFPNDI